jgi:hypothetical protein
MNLRLGRQRLPELFCLVDAVPTTPATVPKTVPYYLDVTEVVYASKIREIIFCPSTKKKGFPDGANPAPRLRLLRMLRNSVLKVSMPSASH